MTKATHPHMLHVTPKGAHLHWGRGVDDREIGRAGRAARAFLGPERAAPSGIAAGYYPFGVNADGNAHIGARLKTMEDFT